MRPKLGTGHRLFVAFALLVSTFAFASYLALEHVRSIHDGLLEMKHYEDGVRASLELASAVRDQYAHQAHTIILGDESHLVLYARATRHVADTIEQVRRYATRSDERGWVDDVETASGKLDHLFRDRIVPAVLKRDTAVVQAEHAQAQLLVTLIQGRSDRLVERFETSIAQFRAEVAEMQVAALRWTVFFLVGAPLLAGLVGLYVQRSVARPVARLQAGAARVASGDLDSRIEIDSSDEFGALARQFNAMTQALKEHQERLVQHEKLAGIGRLAAGVAHEINNPLAVILGYARLLGRKATGELGADLQIIEDESLRAKAIVDDLLDLARPSHVERDRVDLRALADEVVGRLAETSVLDGVAVSVVGEGTVAGSAPKLRQVVLNLVKNAAEAVAPSGTVHDRDRHRPGIGDRGRAGLGPGALARRARARVRAVLHQQAQGHGARAGGVEGDRPGSWRDHPGDEPGLRRRTVRGPVARGVRRGAGLDGPGADTGGGRQGEHPGAPRADPGRGAPGDQGGGWAAGHLARRLPGVRRGGDRPADAGGRWVRGPPGGEVAGAGHRGRHDDGPCHGAGRGQRDEAGGIRLPAEALRPGRGLAGGGPRPGAETAPDAGPARGGGRPRLVPRPGRQEPRHAGALPAPGAGRRAGHHRAPQRGDGHRQGARRPRDPHPQRPQGADASSR